MNDWGYVISRPDGEVLYEDFGYETEADAKEYGKKKRNKFREKTRLTVEQRWCEIE